MNISFLICSQRPLTTASGKVGVLAPCSFIAFLIGIDGFKAKTTDIANIITNALTDSTKTQIEYFLCPSVTKI